MAWLFVVPRKARFTSILLLKKSIFPNSSITLSFTETAKRGSKGGYSFTKKDELKMMRQAMETDEIFTQTADKEERMPHCATP